MSNSQSNYPPAKATRELSEAGDFTSTTISSLIELSNLGRPKSTDELRQRIKYYFEFCADRNFKLGIESLSLSLGISRATFWNWCNGQGVSDEWSDICKQARQCVVAFVESATVSGRISPPVGIFCLKNLASWRDTLSFEDVSPTEADRGKVIKASMLPFLKDNESEGKGFENL